MRPIQIVLVCGAVVAALIIAVLARSAFAPKPQPVAATAAPVKPKIHVLVAAKDIAAGDQLENASLEWRDWPEESVNPDDIVDGRPGPRREDMIGARAREALSKGAPLLPRQVYKVGQGGFLAAVLQPGYRAVSMSLSPDSAAGGFILPGDHIDIVLTHQIPGMVGQTWRSDTILENVKVLAVGSDTQPSLHQQTATAQTATLEVKPEGAELLTRAKSEGSLSLVLRAIPDGLKGDTPRRAEVKAQVVQGANGVHVYRVGVGQEMAGAP